MVEKKMKCLIGKDEFVSLQNHKIVCYFSHLVNHL